MSTTKPPAAPAVHSAGRRRIALDAWWQVPDWYRPGTLEARPLPVLVPLWQPPWLLALVLTAANAAVLYRATLPLALPSLPGSLLAVRGGSPAQSGGAAGYGLAYGVAVVAPAGWFLCQCLLVLS